MPAVINPVLPGFNPDPSICRRGDDVYVATSTFEWYPGVQIHHSRNLQDWTLAARPLSRKSQLDMRGNPDNCGVWAPSLSWHDGLFWLIYTDVKRFDGNYKDAHNYLVTAPEIDGPWSEPIYMNSSGFDPSLFHDTDGRRWFLNMEWDFRGSQPHRDPPAGFFSGILLQEYDHSSGQLVGPCKKIFTRSEIGMSEAPHLFKRSDYYYLVVAEGGTGYEHAVTHARSKSIDGPYELHPDVAVLTTRGKPHAPLQRVGHGQFIELDNGQVWHTFLCSRPLPDTRLSPMGRETGIARCEWRDDWLYHLGDKQVPAVSVPAAADANSRTDTRIDLTIAAYLFEDETLPDDFQWLRTPDTSRIFSTTARPGTLRLYGRESIGSWFEQSLVARRQTAWSYSAETTLEFTPLTFQTQAGLVCYYNRTQFFYLCVTANDEGRRVLCMQCCTDYPEGFLQLPLGDGQVIEDEGLVRLGVDVNMGQGQFRFALGGGKAGTGKDGSGTADDVNAVSEKPSDADWQLLGPVFDASLLSDEGGRGEHGSFTGAFVGMAAQDARGLGASADFHEFHYINRSMQ